MGGGGTFGKHPFTEGVGTGGQGTWGRPVSSYL